MCGVDSSKRLDEQAVNGGADTRQTRRLRVERRAGGWWAGGLVVVEFVSDNYRGGIQ